MSSQTSASWTERLEKPASAAATVLGVLWLGVFPLLGMLWMNTWPISIPLSYAMMTQSKWELAVLLSVLTAVLFPLLLMGSWRKLNWKHPGRWLLLGYFAWLVLSARFGSYAGLKNISGESVVWVGAGRFEGLSTQLCYLIIALGMSLCRPNRKVLTLAAAAGLLVMAGVTFAQYAGVNAWGLYPTGRSIYTNYEFQGTLGNIDMVAGYLALMTPLLLGAWVMLGDTVSLCAVPAGLMGVVMMLMIDVQSGLIALLLMAALLLAVSLYLPAVRWRGLTVLGLLLLCFSLRQLIGLPWVDGLKAPWNLPQRADAVLPQLSGSEPVIFPWAFSLKKLIPAFMSLPVFGFAYYERKEPSRPVPLKWIIAACAALAAAALLAVWLVNVPQNLGAVWELHEILNGRMQDSFGSERYGIWRHTLLLARENLLFGTGSDTFLQAMRLHLAETGAHFNQLFDNPHNLFLAVLMQNGLPALLLLLGALGAMIFGSRKHRTGLVLACAMLCYLMQCMFSFSLCIVTPIFWAVAGLSMASGQNDLQPEKKG